MTNESKTYCAIAALLDEEFELLRDPNPRALTDIVHRKAALSDELASAELDLGQVQALRALALRNQTRMTAVVKGISAVLSVLQEMHMRNASAMHYAPGGHRTRILGPASNLTRRA